jgi:hypothetical protein
MVGIDVGTIVPDVRNDDTAEGSGKINAHATRGIISRIKSCGDRHVGLLTCCRVGSFARSHGHDLLAHDHEAVVKDPHHHNEENGQNERELDERLALAPDAPLSHPVNVGESGHGSFV